MKTSLEAVDFAYKALSSSPLAGMISGGIWKVKRPQNSSLEDIVINALPLTKSPLQRGIINVNIYVPNLELGTDPKDKSQPNTLRLKTLGQQVQTLFEDYYSPDRKTNLQIEKDQLFDEGNAHFLNFRILFYSH
jgi:hypothetical protein